MQIVEKRVSELIPYKKNPRKNDEAVEYVKNSIQAFGFKVPIVIDKDNVVVAGHTRLKAAKKIGLKQVPCIIADDLDEEQIKAFRLADNKVGELAEWDYDLLSDELGDISIDMSDFGFDFEIEETQPEQVEEVEVPEPPKEPKSKYGEVYQLGNHRLMCGDSTNEEDVAKLMNGVKADMVFADPPYGMNAVSKSGVLSEKYKNDILNDDDNTVAINSFNLCKNYFKDTKQVWWGANYYTECLPSAECWIVWDKNNGGSDQTDCELAWTNFRSVVRQFTMASEKINRVHPTQKPLNLISQIFKKFDKNNEYNNIVDLFGGSGSTLITCEQLERKCHMMELDPKYVDVIIERWENYTGKKAQLLEE